MTFFPGLQAARVPLDGTAAFSGSAPISPPSLDSSSMTWLQDTPGQLALRQLRHHTKNALQRLLSQIAGCPGLQRDPAGRALALDLERRILTSASLSDALFGMTAAPATLHARLLSLGRAIVDLMADGDQEITVTVAIDGICPAGYDDLLVRVAHELIGNAVKHGMHLRLVGRIAVTVEAAPDGVSLGVVDDGWGMCLDDGRAKTAGTRQGDGLRIATLLAEQHGGHLVLSRDRCQTTAMMRLPPRPAMPGIGQAGNVL